MRRWNGWGDDTTTYRLRPGGLRFLETRVGPGRPAADAALADVAAVAPPSRLPSHPLVSSDAFERVRHARGQSLPDWVALRSGRLGVLPDGVARPTSRDDVRELLRFAAAAGAAVIPYGGGTSVVGHVNAGPMPTLTVDLRGLNRLLQLDDRGGLATFGAGVIGPDLEAQLRARGFTLGHYPQSFEYSTLGGWVATRSSGQQSLGYGRIESLFAGGVLEGPAGALALPPHPASAAGPDLRELVLGSEGRLGILTEATVRIAALPQLEAFHAVFLPDWERAQAAARQIVQSGLHLSMLRLSTGPETEATLALAGHERLIGALERYLALRRVGPGKCMLLMGITGRERLVSASRKEALAIAGAHGGVHVGRLFGQEWRKNRFRLPYLRNTLWDLGYAIDTLETATTWDRVPGTVLEIEAAIRNATMAPAERVHVFTHLSHLYPHGSSVYTTYVFPLGVTPDDTLAHWQRMKRAASEAIVRSGGTISHQHGVGIDHAPYLAAEKGDLGMAAIREACRVFDPTGMMNPGKLV
jgi:alkyldihydroxyacetonephosphate synthase